MTSAPVVKEESFRRHQVQYSEHNVRQDHSHGGFADQKIQEPKPCLISDEKIPKTKPTRAPKAMTNDMPKRKMRSPDLDGDYMPQATAGFAARFQQTAGL